MSFKDVKRKAAAPEVMTLASVDSDIAVYSDDYEYVNGYSRVNHSDEKYSTVDEQKNITMDSSQVNITQETNSQYIPFRMPRYYDGIDLSSMNIFVRYTRSATSNEGYTSEVVNVQRNDQYIRFGWLIDKTITSQVGDIRFQIEATGSVNKTASNGRITSIEYKWMTKPVGKISIIQGLIGSNSEIEVVPGGGEWQTYENRIIAYVNEAKRAADSVNGLTSRVSTLESKTNQLTNDLNNDKNNLANNYYTKTQTDAQISSSLKPINQAINAIDSLANLTATYDDKSGKLTLKDKKKNTDLASVIINGLANLSVEYSAVDGSGQLTFKNGSAKMFDVKIGSIDPSSAWIEENINPIKSDIKNLKESSSGHDTKIKTLEGSSQNLTKRVSANESSISELKESTADIPQLRNEVTQVTNDIGVIKQTVNGNKEAVSSLGNNFDDLKNRVDKLENNPEASDYDIALSDDQGSLILLQDGETKTTVPLPKGGGGGGESTSKITIDRITEAGAIFLLGDTITIRYNFSSVDSSGDATGNGTATWKVGSTIVGKSVAVQGENSYDITQFLKTGSNSIKLSIADEYGSVGTKTWTITIVDFKLESTFDDTLFYSGEVTFRYTPYGDINKKVHFELDKKEISVIDTQASGRQMTQTISSQKHGAHLLKVYMTATINGQAITSNPVYKDIIWVEPGNNTPIIGCNLPEFTAKQYNTTSIKYVVYDPTHNPATVKLSVDGNIVSTLTVGRTTQIWSYKSTTVGKQSLTISCQKVTKIITANIEKLDINVRPVTTNLVFDFNPTGRNNGEKDWLKINDNLNITVSKNFDTTNGGYQIDDDGDTYFCIKAGTTAAIPYKLFADDAKKTGKNFKFIFKATNVKDYDAQVLRCFSDSIGITVKAQEATLISEQNEISVPYCEDYYMELEFNVLPDNEYTEMVMWINAIPTRVKLYSPSDSFTQTNPVNITVGSDDCDVIIYRMKAYSMNLTDDEILDNFIADGKNADEIIDRYNRNNILDASGNLDPDLLAERCPDLRIIKLECPIFTTGKKNKVPFTSVQQIYKNGRTVDNWISLNGIHNGQGTSSEYYGDSGRNLELNCKNGFTFADNTTAPLYSMDENAYPINYFNVKVNIASSENINNAGLQGEYQELNPYIRPARQKDPRVRDTMQFYPCVVFLKETDIDNAVEFKDGQWHFYAAGDIGNSKKNYDAQGLDPKNHKEFIVEVSNNTDPQCRFLSDDLSNEEWAGDTSFEMRYQNPDCTEEEILAGRQAWNDLLTWVVNATPETFVKDFEKHFIKDSLLFFYLFTERYTMVDNRAKNTFWHTEDLVHWDLCFDYDNDTAMGNDNEGGLTLTYGYEDTDTIGTKSVFNASDNKVFCYIRDYMFNDLQDMYIKMEAKLAWSSNRVLNKLETLQKYKPERLWIIDMRRKYFRPYETKGTTSYLEMMNGDKIPQRRQFQKYQEKFIASKYIGTTATSDVITIRGYTPTNWAGVKPDGTFHIVPYADTYIGVRFGSNLVRQRAKRGNTYAIKSPIAAMNDTEVYVYNASLMQSIGDIAPFYPGYTNFNQGIKMTDILIGSPIKGYKNTNMNDFSIGQNTLLEKLNLENLPNLKKTIDLSNCKNLEEFLADGSGITGVIFAPGGKISKAHLPAIASLTGKNLYKLTDLVISSYSNLTTLSLDNCDTIDILDLLNKAGNLSRVRITGIDWNLEDTTLLDRLSQMTGIDDSGYNAATSVLAGKVHVPVMRQRKLDAYKTLWPDLEISYDSMITQYKITCVNANKTHTVLDVQYVDEGADGENPITRAENPIKTPTIPSTIENDFVFKHWDSAFTKVFADRVITAVYEPIIREYTVEYILKPTPSATETVLQSSVAPYNSYVEYEGSTPTYTAEETAYKFYLFKEWDKSGLVTGNKKIYTVFDSCKYVDGYFDGKDLTNLSEIELYTLMKMSLEQSKTELGDVMNLKFGIDYNFNDVESKEFIADTTEFDGTNYIDTNTAIMDKDRNFTFAIDFEFDTGNTSGATLAQCFQSNGSNGFRLWYGSSVNMTWGTKSSSPASVGNRELVVIRHKAGSEYLYVYSSNLSGNEVSATSLAAIRIPVIPSTLVFGCSKADDGEYEKYAKGKIHWAKLWYADLGENECKEIASWIHETISVAIAKYKEYYLSETGTKRANITFIAKNLLSTNHDYGSVSSGWNKASLNTWLNTRLPKAISPLWQSLIKKVNVVANNGDKAKTTSTSACYFYIPSVFEIDPTISNEPYSAETDSTIPFMTSDISRRRSKVSTPDVYEAYPTRSANVDQNVGTWQWGVDGGEDNPGRVNGYFYPQVSGVLIMFSISCEG